MDPKSLHYRRCHICGVISESPRAIERCQSCGKSVTPFLYFSEEEVQAKPVPRKAQSQFPPLIGLSAYWVG